MIGHVLFVASQIELRRNSMTTETDNHRAHEATMADVQALSLAKDRIVEALHRRIIGQDDVIELLMTAIFARGHGLFVGCAAGDSAAAVVVTVTT